MTHPDNNADAYDYAGTLAKILYPDGCKHPQQREWHWLLKRVQELTATPMPNVALSSGVSVSREDDIISIQIPEHTLLIIVGTDGEPEYSRKENGYYANSSKPVPHLKANVAPQGGVSASAKQCLLMAKALRSRKGWATKVSKVHGDSLSADFEAAAKYMEAAATMLGVHLPTEAAKDVHKAKPASTLDKADSVKYACDKDVRELVEALAAIEKVTWRERTSDVNIANTYQRWLTECRAIASKALSHFDAKPEASVEGRWRPIETAPKDGTWIIGSELNEYGKWARYITYYTASMPWSEQWLFDHDEESEYCPAGWFKETSDDEIVNSCKPTHWMPLPAAPGELSGEEG